MRDEVISIVSFEGRHSVIACFRYFVCYFTTGTDPSVGRHLCFDSGTKNDTTGQKTISRSISFLCQPFIAMIRAQVCDKTVYQHRKCFKFIKFTTS